MKPDYEAMAGLTARQRQRLEMERLAGGGTKIVKAVLAHNVGLTRDQLNQVMMELQKKATVEWGWRDTPTGRELFWLYCQFGHMLARAAGIEVEE